MAARANTAMLDELAIHVRTRAELRPLVVEAVAAAGIAMTWSDGDDADLIVVEAVDGSIAEALAGLARTRRAALIAIVASENHADIAITAGATHIVVAPSLATLVRTIRLALRYVRRLRGIEPPATRRDDAGSSGDALGWLNGRSEDGVPIGVAIVALARFEVVNSAYGRPRGNALLAEAHARIVSATASLDARVERRGGAEFLLLAAADEAAFSSAIARIEVALSKPYAIDGKVMHVGTRIGMAAGQRDVAAMLRRAEDALATAKASDGATTHGASADQAGTVERLAVDLHRAIERAEIDVVFQPQVSIASGAIVGVEALARWDHPLLGPVGAEPLFAAAERAGLGLALSDHIQGLALDRAAAWPAELAHLRMAVNVTAADIARAGFAARFLARIDASGFARGRVTAEITESGLIADLDAAERLLSRLRGAGCRVAIDDFGTGYSSLAYLKALPLDYLKIDRRLTLDLAGSERGSAVVRGVIAIARSLGLETVAEGVEDEAQRALLAAEGCTYYQGFLCAPPLGDAALAGLVEAS